MRMTVSVFFFLILLFAPSLQADEYIAEFKAGYFRPTNDILRQIFPDGWANYQGELSYSPFSRSCRNWWRGLFVWASGNYLHSRGQSAVGIQDCQIKIIPAAGGIKYLHSLPCCVQAYGSIGLKYFWLRLDTKDEFSKRIDRAQGLGGVFSVGALFHPLRFVIIDFFVDYSLKHFDKSNFKVKESDVIPSCVDISGLTFGAGVGVWF